MKSVVLPLYESEVTDIDAMFNPKCKQGSRNLCIVHLMLDAGLRSGEIVELLVGDIDFTKGLIHIRDSKFNKSRMVPMALKLKQYLHKYLILYRGISENQSYNLDLNKDPFFLEVKTTKPITGDVIRCLFSRIKRNTEITRIYPHLLRHTFSTSYILGGGNLESLRILLGHSDIMTTQKYVHLANTYQLMHADIYKLDKLFFKKYY
jgi:integrase/recombinase XerC/integrase/recombinase XerD